jgi:hypothetical protein
LAPHLAWDAGGGVATFDGGGLREVEHRGWDGREMVELGGGLRDRNEVYMSTFVSIGVPLCTMYRLILQI